MLGSDSALRLHGKGANPIPAETRQWFGIYQQEFITPCSPEQNGMVEPMIRTLNDQCARRQRFETMQHASRGHW
jgi:hypothetical protein